MDILYLCDGKACKNCNPDCQLTRNKKHAACDDTQVLVDGSWSKWIPVDVMLPEDNKLVLITVRTSFLGGSMFNCMDVARYTGNMWLIAGALVKDTVIAWMPLPDPYEGGR